MICNSQYLHGRSMKVEGVGFLLRSGFSVNFGYGKAPIFPDFVENFPEFF